ncbi:hypothetical protein [Salinicola avicenniae]|uniref:hypothetical protein n=1 Tax=Salinicola avicenniae TaxID=2916836 RepID=UPI0020731940|nr:MULTISPECIES: hypothetical protein [unclassified Salinicola]
MTETEKATLAYHAGFADEASRQTTAEIWMRADHLALEPLAGKLSGPHSETDDFYRHGRGDAIVYCRSRSDAAVKDEIWKRYGPAGDLYPRLIRWELALSGSGSLGWR